MTIKQHARPHVDMIERLFLTAFIKTEFNIGCSEAVAQIGFVAVGTALRNELQIARKLASEFGWPG